MRHSCQSLKKTTSRRQFFWAAKKLLVRTDLEATPACSSAPEQQHLLDWHLSKEELPSSRPSLGHSITAEIRMTHFAYLTDRHLPPLGAEAGTFFCFPSSPQHSESTVCSRHLSKGKLHPSGTPWCMSTCVASPASGWAVGLLVVHYGPDPPSLQTPHSRYQYHSVEKTSALHSRHIYSNSSYRKSWEGKYGFNHILVGMCWTVGRSKYCKVINKNPNAFRLQIFLIISIGSLTFGVQTNH